MLEYVITIEYSQKTESERTLSYSICIKCKHSRCKRNIDLSEYRQVSIVREFMPVGGGADEKIEKARLVGPACKLW